MTLVCSMYTKFLLGTYIIGLRSNVRIQIEEELQTKSICLVKKSFGISFKEHRPHHHTTFTEHKKHSYDSFSKSLLQLTHYPKEN